MREIKFRAWCLPQRAFIYDPAVSSEDCYLHRIFEDKDFIWMQYTGLKDKNGKEIYEGDILSNGNDIIHSISFHDGAFFWGGAPMNIIKNMADLYPTIYKYHEVIGNIYENPEQLNPGGCAE